MTIQQPHFVLDKEKLLKDYKKLVQKLNCKISYSAKTNLEVARLLEQETNCDFSVHLENELLFIKNMKRVWFLAQGWTKEEIKNLVSKGITKFVVDNAEDLYELIKFVDEKNQKIDLLLRMKLRELTIFTGKYYVFGMPSKEINEQIMELRKNKNIIKLGVHFHRKTQNTSEWNLRKEIEDALNEETLKAIDILNIGGGFPVSYKNSSDQAIESIFEKILKLKALLDEKQIELICEPGRYLAGPCVKLVTHIRRVIGDQIIVNASVYNSAMDTLIAPLKLLVEGELPDNSKECKEYTIKGITPCSMDIFRYKVRLAETPKKGDKIVFLNAGAYNFMTDFCELKKLKTITI
ncbi:decarboxylase [Candidatus Woesearchaeota archaeon]|nr:decarboxylase [Candidatus Woesearchaeota archaeon]